MQDVTGLSLCEALKVLEAEGVTDVEIKMTAPPREVNRQHGPDSRVVRQLSREAENRKARVELTVCNL
jgi:hypothetical protein